MSLGTCKGGGDAGPVGKPETVIARAPDVTLATKSAHVETAGPETTGTGRVDFAAGADTLKIAGRNTTNPPFGITAPMAVIDLLRGVTKVRAYGGAEVQGDGTKRYEVDIDLSKAITATPAGPRRDALHVLDGRLGPGNKLWADVFVDKQLRIRRVLIPFNTAMARPYGQSQVEPQEVSIDYSDFGGNK